jgi:hypothetical protein
MATHGDWSELWDETHQATYYQNNVTGESAWEAPPEWIAAVSAATRTEEREIASKQPAKPPVPSYSDRETSESVEPDAGFQVVGEAISPENIDNGAIMAENALELAKEAAKAAGEKHKELERAAAVAHSAWATASTGVAAEAMMLELGKARTLAIDRAKEAKNAADNSAAWHVAELNLQKTEEMHTQALAAASDAEAKVAQDHSGSKDERSLALQRSMYKKEYRMAEKAVGIASALLEVAKRRAEAEREAVLTQRASNALRGENSADGDDNFEIQSLANSVAVAAVKRVTAERKVTDMMAKEADAAHTLAEAKHEWEVARQVQPAERLIDLGKQLASSKYSAVSASAKLVDAKRAAMKAKQVLRRAQLEQAQSALKKANGGATEATKSAPREKLAEAKAAVAATDEEASKLDVESASEGVEESEWIQMIDPANGSPYYLNSITGASLLRAEQILSRSRSYFKPR